MQNSINDKSFNIQVQEVQSMSGWAFRKLLHTIAMDYGTPQHDEWVVNTLSIDLSDKKLILSHILDSEEYAWCCKSPTRTEAMFNEHINYIEKELYEVCCQVYYDYQEEMGMVCGRYNDNGEYYFYRA